MRCNLKFRNAGIQKVSDYGRFGYPIPNLLDLENYLELGVHVQTATAPRCVLFIFELGSALNNLGWCVYHLPSYTGARYPLILKNTYINLVVGMVCIFIFFTIINNCIYFYYIITIRLQASAGDLTLTT